MTSFFSRLTIAVLATLLCSTLISQNDQDEDETNEDSEDESSPQEETVVSPGWTIEIDVTGLPIEVTPGETTYSEETIEKSPTGEGNLSDLLRLNPNVDFSRDSDLSAGTASLRPDEVSIHGQEFYQNLFLIDGADATNDLNPANSMDIWRTPSLVAPHGGSSPQGYYIDIDLLEKVEVFDSNVPVEYGGFTGGVVSADLKTYDGDDKISFKWGLQRDEWESFHVSEDDITAADRYSAVYTPDYEKSNYKLAFQWGLLDGVGITLGITNRHSTFAQEFEDDTDTVRLLDYEDRIQNIVGKLSVVIGGRGLEFSFRSTSRRHDGLTSTNYTGLFEKEHNGIGYTVSTKYSIANGDMDIKFSFDQLSDILDSSTNYFSYHEHLESSGMSRYEGAFGDSEQQQTRWSFKPKWTRAPLESEGFLSSHQLTLGGEVKMTTSFYKRPEDITFENFWCVRDNGREGCRDQDGDGVSSAGDEYLQSRSFWFAGEVDVSYEEISTYFEDKFSIGNQTGNNAIDVTMGVRADWESYLENFNFSPRVSASRQLFDGTIVSGLSRYYGRSFFRYELNDAIYGWREIFLNLTRPRGRPGEEIPCSDTDFVNCTHRTFDDRSGRSDLDTPYSDEWMIGWSTTAFAIDTSLQYVSRESKKGVSRSRDDDGNYFYTNDGRSSTQSVSASFINSQPVLFGLSETTVSLSVSYKDSESNRQDDGGYDDTLDEELIYYDGKLISAEELPAWDYNVPFGVGFFTTTRFPVWDVTWTNHFNHRQGGTIARDTRENYMDPNTGLSHDIYEDFEFDGLLTVNSKLSWNGRISDRFSGFVNFEVNNLFDKVVDRSRFDTRRRFTQGRRFWIELGVDFR